jgi:arsenate reductase (thioredoxin)
MKKVLFVCIQNAGRSQMAEAFAKQAGLDSRSAGSSPADQVHPEVVEVMHEIGIDVADNAPRALSAEDAEWADTVVTMGCGDTCPYIPGKQYLDWALPDPHGMGIDGVREVRNEIQRRVNDLVQSFGQL